MTKESLAAINNMLDTARKDHDTLLPGRTLGKLKLIVLGHQTRLILFNYNKYNV
jgi:hypothetical protein